MFKKSWKKLINFAYFLWLLDFHGLQQCSSVQAYMNGRNQNSLCNFDSKQGIKKCRHSLENSSPNDLKELTILSIFIQLKRKTVQLFKVYI